MCHLFFDNPSSLDTYVVSSSDAVSSSDVPSLRCLPLDVPSSFDNPSSLDTYLVSSSDAVSTSNVPSLRYLLRRLDKF